MAFTLQAIVGSTTVNLTNSAPFKLLSATGMGGAPVRRVTARGPAQQGDTDLGYRLQAREIELQIGFAATTDALLDGYRDTLASIFKPTASTPVQLRVTRDDAEVRQLDCYTVGVLRIDLVPEHRPGHYHVATVQLRASNPAWYSVTPGTVSVQGSASPDTEWWLAGGVIGSANVLMYGTAPAQGEAWNYAGTLAIDDTWTLAFRSTYEAFGTISGQVKYAFAVRSGGMAQQSFVAKTSAYALWEDGIENLNVYSTGPAMRAGTHTYFISHRPAREDLYGPGWGDVGFSRYDSDTNARGYYDGARLSSYQWAGTQGVWRALAAGSTDTYWQGTIDKYALYAGQIDQATLHLYMNDERGDALASALAIPYAGDMPEYPVIRITGPISSPSITSSATGDTLDFGTITIGSGAVYSIDTRYGYKTITSGTVNKRSELTADSDLATWRLIPTFDGVNVLTLGGSAIGPSTKIEVVYYNRYLSF